MAWPVSRATNAEQEVAAAKYPKIRLLQIPRAPAGQPASDVSAAWTPCNPKTVPSFSALGYFFGRYLHKELGVPVGLINTSWGGTRIEPWTPPAGFASVPTLHGIVKQIEEADAKYADACRKTLDAIEAWIPRARTALVTSKRVPPKPAWPQHLLANRGRPTGLYNGMVHPLVPFGFRGALWYQGEANRADGMLYHDKMKALINGWRSVWAQGDFPFYFVQLAPYRYKGEPTMLPRLWESQTATLSVPNTGMAVTVDVVDNIKDIHPTNKQDPGKRLALWALANVYGREGIVYSGPLYKSMAVEGNKVRLRFDHVGSGLVSRDGKPLSNFEIAGADKKFVEAKAEIDGEAVVVSADGVAAPVAVRFGWHQESQPNLSNKEGLPASPFRTDSW
jgi:sialate O-acetylesterase